MAHPADFMVSAAKHCDTLKNNSSRDLISYVPVKLLGQVDVCKN